MHVLGHWTLLHGVVWDIVLLGGGGGGGGGGVGGGGGGGGGEPHRTTPFKYRNYFGTNIFCPWKGSP